MIVVDSQESSIFDADVKLASATTVFGMLSTGTTGLVDFEKIPCGAWTITAAKEGFDTVARPAQIESGAKLEIRIILTPKMQISSVDVTDKPAAAVEQSASQNNELRPVEVKALPTNPATVTDTLPLVPGIVRTANGELKIDGAGEERSTMVVNQSDITDPVTGRFGQAIPIDSVETVNVLTTPFLAQYGRFTQSVIAVETRRGGEKWHSELNDPFPDFRIRSYHMRGIRNETPRFSVGGPLISNRIYLMTAIHYELDKTPSRTLPFPYNESKKELVNSFTQFDFILSPKQHLTATAHISPQHTNFVGLDFFTPQLAAPSYAQQNYLGTIVHHFGFLDGILDTTVSIQRFDARIGAQGDADMIVAPAGNRGNFFGEQHRTGRRTEWLETWSLAPLQVSGTHLAKMGMSYTNLGNEGRFEYHNVSIVDQTGKLQQRVDFENQNPFNRTDLEATAYVQDHWSITPRLSFDYGARLEHQRLASSFRIAPREGVAWNPFGNSRTVIRAGYGQFYDHLPLDIYTFGRYPLRTITYYAPDGNVLGEPVPYINVIGSITGPRSFLVRGQQVAGAFSPRGSTLNIQLEHAFEKLLRLRAVYSDSRSVGLVTIDPGILDTTNEIVLNGDGKSRYRQLEVTGRFAWTGGQQMTLSYTRSRAEGNLNTFDSFLGNFPTLLVRPNIYSNLPADIPNRFLAWGRVLTHVWKLIALPIVEYRNGVPYARLDASQNYSGTPYLDSMRFPKLFSADARLLRDFKVRAKYTVRLSLTTFNITNHFNALAFHNNVADPDYGIFFGNYRRRYRGDFEILF